MDQLSDVKEEDPRHHTAFRSLGEARTSLKASQEDSFRSFEGARTSLKASQGVS